MKITEKINLLPQSIFLKDYTTFKIGGMCSTFYEPITLKDTLALWTQVHSENLPYFILGAGSNILASDEPLNRTIICLSQWRNIEVKDTIIRAQAGVTVNQLASVALEQGLSGLEFIYGLPATVGGAVFMNARCFGADISTCLKEVKFLNSQGRIETYHKDPKDFSYKVSPFQSKDCLILEALFSLHPANKEQMKTHMQANWQHRQDKGHFKAPSGGSYFKNNYQVGISSGALIESSGMRGAMIGGAQVAPWHANFLINRRDATAKDVLNLADQIKEKVREQTGLELEEEVLFLQ